MAFTVPFVVERKMNEIMQSTDGNKYMWYLHETTPNRCVYVCCTRRCVYAVSYTHLDVYKRQVCNLRKVRAYASVKKCQLVTCANEDIVEEKPMKERDTYTVSLVTAWGIQMLTCSRHKLHCKTRPSFWINVYITNFMETFQLPVLINSNSNLNSLNLHMSSMNFKKILKRL